MAAVWAIPTADQERKKNVPTGRLLAEGSSLAANILLLGFDLELRLSAIAALTGRVDVRFAGTTLIAPIAGKRMSR